MNILGKHLWERKYVDLWTIVHLLTGACFSFAILFYHSPFLQSFLVFFLFAIVWEIAEHINKAGEVFTNQITDVISGVVGFLLAAYYIPILASALREQIGYFTVLYVIAWAFAHFGFQSLAIHTGKDLKKHQTSFSRSLALYVVVVAAIWAF